MYGGMVFAILAWPGSYLIWLFQGCSPFMPFVSDFGDGASGPLFSAGLFLASLCLVPTWFDFYQSTRTGMESGRFLWRCMHVGLPAVGVWCSVSIAGVALNPWDYRIVAHLLSALGIFFGGALFAALASVIDWHRGLSFRRPLALVVVAVTAEVLMFVFLGLGLDDLRASGEASGSANDGSASMELMKTDYLAYCQGRDVCSGTTCLPTMHGNSKVNIGALCEWLLLGSVTLLAFAKLHAELHDWPECSRAARAGCGRDAPLMSAGASLQPSDACGSEGS